MPLLCLGLSHNTAPVEVRERHAFPVHRMGEALIALRDYEAVAEAFMVQTCGRIEFYAEVDDYELGVAQLKRFLLNFRHGNVGDMDSYMYTLLGDQAVEHLLRVSTGLDSMLIGEAEILHQVKEAYAQAQRARSLGDVLHALVRTALEAGKAARSQTEIGGSSTSIATAAVSFAKQQAGTLAGASVVVLGAGKMGALVARRLKAEGCADIAVVNRSPVRAREVVTRIGVGRALELDQLIDAMRGADIVVTSTGADDFLLTVENIGAALRTRPERPLHVIDIAVPRDADPEIAKIDGVRLVDVDGLKDAVDDTLARRRTAIPAVEEIIAEHTDRFGQWYRSRVAVPTIAGLVHRADAIRGAELERLFARCPDLTEREKMLVTGMSMTIVSKLLHGAVTKIRAKAIVDRDDALEAAHMLDELFDLRAATADE